MTFQQGQILLDIVFRCNSKNGGEFLILTSFILKNCHVHVICSWFAVSLGGCLWSLAQRGRGFLNGWTLPLAHQAPECLPCAGVVAHICLAKLSCQDLGFEFSDGFSQLQINHAEKDEKPINKFPHFGTQPGP